MGYCFAVVASVLSFGVALWADRHMARPMTPFLSGFAAVIAAAAWAGFGPGLFATILVAIWCAVLLRAEHHEITGMVSRCAIFCAEGILLSVGSGWLRRARRRALESRHWHRSLMETSNEGIWVLDEDGLVVYSNPRMAEILGCHPDEVSGRRMDEFFFPEELSIERIRFQNRRQGRREQFDRRLRRKDGSEVWVLACCSSFSGEPGGSNAVLAMMTDITERKLAEQALRRSEERFRGLFENVLEGVYQSTPDGRIIAANPMLLNMLGLASEAELNDVNIARDLYIDPNVRKQLLERLEREGSFRNVEYQLRRRDGRTISVRENARAIRDDSGRVAYYEGTLSDVTELQEAESQLQKAKHRESVETVANSIPHEFRNFLTVVAGYSHLLLEDLPESHPARGPAQNIMKAVDEASALMAQLAAFSDLPERTPVDLNHALLAHEDNLKRAGGAPLKLSLFPWPLPVLADRDQLRQIIAEFTRNADEVWSEAVRADGAFVRAHEGSRTGLFARLSVRSGLPAPNTPRLERWLLQCGGFALADEKAVYLPIADDAAPLLVARLSRSEPQETVLLVEEEPLIREVSRDLLERQGYRVILAADGDEAQRIERYGHTFDVMIADLRSADATAELARKLRSARPALKVLMIGVQADESEMYLEKPFSAEALSKQIRRMLDS